ncbi:glycosyltransferase family 4 protein [Collinsella tanakaei]|uniref:glycosyltransferase family 4 protein n=1 Tax=Collinsella tanakaei TaxID=626935 RepID=UPI00195CABB8|nr:glycosyltransferase family 4 protein [Collinsella tanakaei]MBM6867159.1 glycosyltransferase family 4 protein [Collinsella tanakaei]
MTLFVGPVAKTGGPAIKNSITLKHLFPVGGCALVNTYSRRLGSRLGGIARTVLSKDDQAIIAVSRKGRAVLWPIVHRKAKADPSFRYALVCIGGTVADEAGSSDSLLDCMGDASLVAVETRGVVERLRVLGVENVHLMTNFVDDLSSRRMAPRPVARGSLRFVFLSSVRNKKGVGTMVSAFREAVASGLEASLDIYGPVKADFDRSVLEGIGEDEPISYRGVVLNSEVVETLAGYDCFVFPSEYEAEGFPAVLAEAMAAGLPILASDVCYNSEIVVDGRNGWLFPAGNATALARLFVRCEGRREELARMAAFNYEDCLRYDAAVVVDGFRRALEGRGWSL